MAISDEWMDRLLQHDFISTKKGRGQSSLLINGIGRAHSKKRPRAVIGGGNRSDGRSLQGSDPILQPMDMSRFAKKRRLNNEEEKLNDPLHGHGMIQPRAQR